LPNTTRRCTNRIQKVLCCPPQKIGKELNRMALKVAGIQEEKGGKKKFSLFS